MSVFRKLADRAITALGGISHDHYNDLVESMKRVNENHDKLLADYERLKTVDNINKAELLKEVDECKYLYQKKLQEPAYDAITQSPYWGFKNTTLPGQIDPNTYMFDDDVSIPGTYRSKCFNDDGSAFVQYRIQFGKNISKKLSEITSPEMQQYRAVEEADRSDLFGSVIKTLYNTGALKCSLGVDEHGNYVLCAAINLQHPTDDMMNDNTPS